MSKSIKLFSFLLLFTAIASAQVSSVWKTLPRLKTPMQEKLYLHFDKPAYTAGERMWFRAYLANADTHVPDTASCAVYVELINNVDSLIQRIKLPHKHGVFAGSLALSELLPEGNYRLRAYTNWMRNAGAEYFFNQTFFVGNSLSSQVQTKVNYRFVDKKKAFAEISFSEFNKPLAGKKVNYYLNVSGYNKNEKQVLTAADGKILVEYNPSQIDIKKPLIHLAYTDNSSKYERNIILPAKNDFDVQFFPEGGSLVYGEGNRVAFKAIQINGLSTDVTGALYSQNNQKIIEFGSTHLGMGVFHFIPDSAKQYYALVKNAAGEEKRYELPLAMPSNITLSTNLVDGKMFIGVKTKAVVDTLFLVGHSRSAVFCSLPITDLSKIVMFNQNELRPGITSFTLTDKNGQPLAERLLFVRPQSQSKVKIEFDKKTYSKRERVNCELQVRDADGKPVQGSFSVSVTDASDVELDSTAQNVESYLLLSSDLRGNIEQPSVYFDPNNAKANEQLDLLMQTQGWKRFNTAKVFNGQAPVAQHFLEKGQAITGTVKAGILNRAKKGTQVHVLGHSIQYFNSTETDSLGHFEFTGFQFPDSTQFTIKALQKRGIKDAVEITVDQDSFPAFTEEYVTADRVKSVNQSQLEASKQRFFSENGMFFVQLKEFEFVEKKEEPETVTDTEYFNSVVDYELQGEALRAQANLPFSHLVRSLPGLGSWTEYPVLDEAKIYGEDNNGPEQSGPYFAWDGTVYSYDEVRSVYVGDLDAVRVMKKLSSNSKNKLDDILIILAFKKGKSIFNSQYVEQNFERFTPLGYARAVEFYQPKYELEANKASTKLDWRSTLLWQAELTTDAKGRANCWFYTADRPSRYNLQLQGITPQGEPCHFEGSYQLLKP